MTRYEDLVNAVADRERVPRTVAQAMVDTENAARDAGLVIPEAWGGGSYGLTMITLRTARSLGYPGHESGLRDPETNLTWGLRYLRQMFDRVGRGDWVRAVAAYNEGPDIDPWPAALPASTVKHIERFRRNWERWRARSPDFQPPLTLRAGVGGWLLALLILGAIVPRLLRGRPTRRTR